MVKVNDIKKLSKNWLQYIVSEDIKYGYLPRSFTALDKLPKRGC